MACPTCSLIPTKRPRRSLELEGKLASSSLKYTGSHHRKLRRGLISGVELVSISIGVRQLRDAEAVKFKTKHTYINARSQVCGGDPVRSKIVFAIRLTSWYLRSAGF
jgi:hypothetical protein